MGKLTPPNYSGSSSFEDFEQFVTRLLRHFKTLQVMSPDFNQVHIWLMGQSFMGDALDWFNHTIDTNDDHSVGWGFEMAVIALKERFVHRSSIQDAATKFDLLAQGKRSVIDFYNKLRSLAMCMAEKPSDYDIKQRFINGLLSVISTCITDYGYTAEGYDIEDLLQVSKQVEDARQYVAKQHPHAVGTGQLAYKQAASKPNNNTIAATATQSNTKVVRYNGGHGPTKNHHNPSRPYGNTRPQDKPAHKPMAKYLAIAGPSKISASAVTLPPKEKPMDIAALICFLCG